MENLTPILTAFAVLTPVTTGIVSLYKTMAPKYTQYAPLASVVAGILLAWIASTIVPGIAIGAIILGGLVLGMSAAGLYSGTKAIVNQ